MCGMAKWEGAIRITPPARAKRGLSLGGMSPKPRPHTLDARRSRKERVTINRLQLAVTSFPTTRVRNTGRLRWTAIGAEAMVGDRDERRHAARQCNQALDLHPHVQLRATHGETLESILAQVIEGVEVVVLDGGSTDDTPAVVLPFKRSIRPSLPPPRRAGGHRSRHGTGRAGEGGILLAVLCDDAMRPGAIRKMLAELESGSTCTWAV